MYVSDEDFDATFSTSFRIIADSPIRKTRDGFMIGTDFRVEHTIEGTPAFEAWLQRYSREHHQPPEAYTNLQKAYENMQQQIKEIMPKLPMCKAYFNMLGVIHFFSSYFTTLKEAGKVPVLPPMAIDRHYDFPALLPPLPIRQYREVEVFSVLDFWKDAFKEPEAKLVSYFEKAVQGKDSEADRAWTVQHIYPKLMTFIRDNDSSSEFSIAGMSESERKALTGNVLDFTIHEYRQAFEKPHDFLQDGLDGKQEQLQMVQTARTANEAAVRQQFHENLVEQLGENYRSITSAGRLASLEEQFVQEALARVQAQRVQRSGAMKNKTEAAINSSLGLHRQFLLYYIDNSQAMSFDHFLKLADLDMPLSGGLLFDQSEDRYKKYKVIGGCGLSLDNAPPQQIAQGPAVVEEAWRSLLNTDAEDMAKLNYQGQDFIAFKMQVQKAPVSATASQNYIWMNSLLYDGAAKAEAMTGKQSTRPDNAEAKAEFWNLAKAIFSEDMAGFRHVLAQAYRKPELLKQILNFKDEQGQGLAHFAVSRHIDFIRVLQSLKIDLLQTDNAGYTALHTAAASGKVEHLQKLIQYCPQLLNLKAKNGATAVYIAAQQGHTEQLQWLLRRGEETNAITTSGMTSLYSALHNGHENAAVLLMNDKTLLNRGLPDGTTPLYLAADTGNEAMLLALLEEGADPNIARKDSMTPAIAAAKQGHIKILQLLALYNVDFNDQMQEGSTALHHAVAANSIAAVAFLAERTDLSLATSQKETVLHQALQARRADYAKLLIDKMKLPQLQAPDSFGTSPFSMALDYNLVDIAEMLVEKGAHSPGQGSDRFALSMVEMLDEQQFSHWYEKGYITTAQLKVKDNYGYTPEIRALVTGRENLVHMFRTEFENTELNMFNKTLEHSGLKIIHYAALHGMLDLLDDYFLQASPGQLTDDYIKASHAMSDQQMTLAMFAAKGGKAEALKTILEYDKNRTETENEQLIRFAVESGDLDTVKVLTSNMYEPVDRQGNTLLHLAVAANRPHLAATFIRQKALLNQRNTHGETPVDQALKNRSILFGNMFFSDDAEKPVQFNAAMLQTALASHALFEANYILKQLGSDVIRQEKGLLHAAINANALDIVSELLHKGAAADVLTEGRTPLMLAAEKGLADIVTQLLPWTKSLHMLHDGHNALHKAVINSQWDAACRLIDAGMNPAVKTRNGLSLVQLASDKSNKVLAEKLLKGRTAEYYDIKNELIQSVAQKNTVKLQRLLKTLKNTDNIVLNGVNMPLLHVLARHELMPSRSSYTREEYLLQNQDGASTLHVLAQAGDVESIQKAVKSGIDIAAVKDRHNQSLLFDSLNDKELKVLRSDLVSKFDLNEQDVVGNTLMHAALQAKNGTAMERLILLNVDLEKLNKGNQKAIHIAVNNNLTLAVRFMLSSSISLKESDYIHSVNLIAAAAKNKNIEMLQMLLSAGARYDVMNASNLSAFESALLNSNLQCVSRLVDAGAPIDEYGALGKTPVHMAVQNKDPQVLKYLLENDADPNARTVDSENETRKITSGVTPLMLAGRSNAGLDKFKILQSYGADADILDDQGDSLVKYAGLSGNAEIINHIQDLSILNYDTARQGMTYAVLQDKVDVLESFLSLGFEPGFIQTGLMNLANYAAAHDAPKTLGWLEAHGVSLENETSEMKKPIHYAVENGNTAAAEQLLEAGIDINTLNKNNESLLHFAVENNRLMTAAYLLAHDIDPDVQDVLDRKAVDAAFMYGFGDIAKLLVMLGSMPTIAKQNVHNSLGSMFDAMQHELIENRNKGNSLLHYAVSQDDLMAAAVLIKRGMQAEIQNNEGQTLMHLAQSPQMLRLLLENDLGVDIEDQQQNSAVMAQVQSGNIQNTELLLEAGFSVETINKAGHTALSLAYDAGLNSLFDKVLAAVKQDKNRQGNNAVLDLMAGPMTPREYIIHDMNGHGLNPLTLNFKDKKQQLQIQQFFKNKEVMEFILTWVKQDLIVKNPDGDSLKLLAYLLHDENMIEILKPYSKGNELVIPKENGQYPLCNHLNTIVGTPDFNRFKEAYKEVLPEMAYQHMLAVLKSDDIEEFGKFSRVYSELQGSPMLEKRFLNNPPEERFAALASMQIFKQHIEQVLASNSKREDKAQYILTQTGDFLLHKSSPQTAVDNILAVNTIAELHDGSVFQTNFWLALVTDPGTEFQILYAALQIPELREVMLQKSAELFESFALENGAADYSKTSMLFRSINEHMPPMSRSDYEQLCATVRSDSMAAIRMLGKGNMLNMSLEYSSKFLKTLEALVNSGRDPHNVLMNIFRGLNNIKPDFLDYSDFALEKAEEFKNLLAANDTSANSFIITYTKEIMHKLEYGVMPDEGEYDLDKLRPLLNLQTDKAAAFRRYLYNQIFSTNINRNTGFQKKLGNILYHADSQMFKINKAFYEVTSMPTPLYNADPYRSSMNELNKQICKNYQQDYMNLAQVLGGDYKLQQLIDSKQLIKLFELLLSNSNRVAASGIHRQGLILFDVYYKKKMAKQYGNSYRLSLDSHRNLLNSKRSEVQRSASSGRYSQQILNIFRDSVFFGGDL